ncbi:MULTISPECIES: transposase-like zinc-binding domain-containing protein [Bacteria]
MKKCFFCGSKNVIRNGLRVRSQRYKCNDCGVVLMMAFAEINHR